MVLSANPTLLNLFVFNLKYIFVSLRMYNSRIKLLTLISPIKIWC